MPINALHTKVGFEGARLQPCREDVHGIWALAPEGTPSSPSKAPLSCHFLMLGTKVPSDMEICLDGTAAAVPFQSIAQRNTAHRDNSHFTTRALMSSLLFVVSTMLV